MTPCRWASGSRRFEGTCCLNVRGPAVRADPSTNMATYRHGDKRPRVTSHSVCTLIKLLTLQSPALLCSSLCPPSQHSLLCQSHPAVSYSLSAGLSDVKRQSRGLNLTAPFLIFRTVLAFMNCIIQVTSDNLLVIRRIKEQSGTSPR
jgi:hypothetical protein